MVIKGMLHTNQKIFEQKFNELANVVYITFLSWRINLAKDNDKNVMQFIVLNVF